MTGASAIIIIPCQCQSEAYAPLMGACMLACLCVRVQLVRVECQPNNATPIIIYSMDDAGQLIYAGDVLQAVPGGRRRRLITPIRSVHAGTQLAAGRGGEAYDPAPARRQRAGSRRLAQSEGEETVVVVITHIVRLVETLPPSPPPVSSAPGQAQPVRPLAVVAGPCISLL